MLNGKTDLIWALENAIANFDVTNDQRRILKFDNTEYQAFLTSFNSAKDIVNLSDQMIDKLAINIDINENRQSFIATIKFLKELVEISRQEGGNISLNDNQLAVMEELKHLIASTIKKNEALISVLGETTEETNQKYISALNILTSNNLLSEKDYDLIEEVVMKLYVKDNGPMLNEIMTYLNQRNAEKLEKIYLADNKSSTLNNALKQAQVTKKSHEEMLSKFNIRLINYIQRSKQHSKTYQGVLGVEKIQKLKEILALLGHNYDILPANIKVALAQIEDLKEFEEFAYYLKEKNPIILNNLNPHNINGFIFLLINSNQAIVEKVLHELTYVHSVSDQTISRCINGITTIFGAKHYESFLANSTLIKSVGASIEKIIASSPLFLVTSNYEMKSVLKKLIERGVELKLVLENCAYTLSYNPEQIEANIKILEAYGFDLNCFFKEKSGYTILNNSDLATKLDYLIEGDLNGYVHSNPETSANTLRTLIIKRIYYAYKYKLDVWGRVNENEYHQLIKQSNLVIDEPSISLLFTEYPMLEVLENEYLLELSALKRKTELLFGQRTISRLKTYRVFKILVENNVAPKEAILYALTYRTDLNITEYTMINNAVERLVS